MADRRRAAAAAMIVIAALIAVAIVGPFVTADPRRGDLDSGVSAIGAPLPPSASAPLGTDALGRDELARVIAGAGSSLAIAALATAIALALGMAVGVTAGYAGGWIDGGLMRSVDLALAFPFLLLAVLLAALLRSRDEASGTAVVVMTLGVASWPPIARVIRAKTAVVARADFVIAARALGASPWRVAVRHLAPNVAGTAVALGALVFAQNLLAEAALSYVGLGPPPPAASWGRMIYEARAYYRTAPWLIAAPGVAIALSVLAFHALASALEDGE